MAFKACRTTQFRDYAAAFPQDQWREREHQHPQQSAKHREAFRQGP